MKKLLTILILSLVGVTILAQENVTTTTLYPTNNEGDIVVGDSWGNNLQLPATNLFWRTGDYIELTFDYIDNQIQIQSQDYKTNLSECLSFSSLSYDDSAQSYYLSIDLTDSNLETVKSGFRVKGKYIKIKKVVLVTGESTETDLSTSETITGNWSQDVYVESSTTGLSDAATGNKIKVYLEKCYNQLKFQKIKDSSWSDIQTGSGEDVLGTIDLATTSTAKLDYYADLEGSSAIVIQGKNYTLKKVELKTYNCSFTANGGTGGSISVKKDGESDVTSETSFPYHTTVIATAIPETGYDFAGWTSGDLTLTDEQKNNSELSVTLTSNVTVTASFKKKTFKVEAVSEDADKGSVSFSTGSSGDSFDYGSSVTITATPKEGTDYEFDKWTKTGDDTWNASDAASNNPLTITNLDGNWALTASFKEATTSASTIWEGSTSLDWGADPGVNVSLSKDLFSSAVVGSVIKIEGTTSSEPQIKLSINYPWKDCDQVTALPLQYTIASAADIESIKSNGMQIQGQNAVITKVTLDNSNPATLYTYTLTVTDVNETQGTVTVTGKTSDNKYESGATIKVVAEAKEGYRFVNWTNGSNVVVSTDAEYTITITDGGSLTLTANFIQQFTVTATSEDTSKGTVAITNADASNKYDAGSNVTVTASPLEGFIFDKWTKDGDTEWSSTSNPQTIENLAADWTLTASFKDAKILDWSHEYEVSKDLFSSVETGGKVKINFTFTNGESNGSLQIVHRTAGGGGWNYIPEATSGTPTPSNTVTASPFTIDVTETLATNLKAYGLILKGNNVTFSSVELEAAPVTNHTVTISSVSGGTITIKNGETPVKSGDEIEANTVLTLTAEPDATHNFSNWVITTGESTDETKTSTSATYTVTSDVTIGATFAGIVVPAFSLDGFSPLTPESPKTTPTYDTTNHVFTTESDWTSIQLYIGNNSTYSGSKLVVKTQEEAKLRVTVYYVGEGNAASSYSTATKNHVVDIDSEKKIDKVIIDNTETGTVTFTEFALDPSYTLTITAPENGSFTVKSGETELAGASVAYGTSLTLTPKANEGYSFTKWTINDEDITDNPYTFTLTEATTIAATFTANPVVTPVFTDGKADLSKFAGAENGIYDTSSHTISGAAWKDVSLSIPESEGVNGAELSLTFNKAANVKVFYNYGGTQYDFQAQSKVIRFTLGDNDKKLTAITIQSAVADQNITLQEVAVNSSATNLVDPTDATISSLATGLGSDGSIASEEVLSNIIAGDKIRITYDGGTSVSHELELQHKDSNWQGTAIPLDVVNSTAIEFTVSEGDMLTNIQAGRLYVSNHKNATISKVERITTAQETDPNEQDLSATINTGTDGNLTDAYAPYWKFLNAAAGDKINVYVSDVAASTSYSLKGHGENGTNEDSGWTKLDGTEDQNTLETSASKIEYIFTDNSLAYVKAHGLYLKLEAGSFKVSKIAIISATAIPTSEPVALNEGDEEPDASTVDVTEVFSTQTALGNYDVNSVQVVATAFVNVKTNDYIKVYLSSMTDNSELAFQNLGTWQNLTGFTTVKPSKNATKYVYKITSSSLTELQAGGLVIKGQDCTVDKIELLTAKSETPTAISLIDRFSAGSEAVTYTEHVMTTTEDNKYIQAWISGDNISGKRLVISATGDNPPIMNILVQYNGENEKSITYAGNTSTSSRVLKLDETKTIQKVQIYLPTKGTVSFNEIYIDNEDNSNAEVAMFKLTTTSVNGQITVKKVGETANTDDREFEYGTQLTLTATANEGYEFVKWMNGDTELTANSDKSLTVTMDADVTIEAVFKLSMLNYEDSCTLWTGSENLGTEWPAVASQSATVGGILEEGEKFLITVSAIEKDATDIQVTVRSADYNHTLGFSKFDDFDSYPAEVKLILSAADVTAFKSGFHITGTNCTVTKVVLYKPTPVNRTERTLLEKTQAVGDGIEINRGLFSNAAEEDVLKVYFEVASGTAKINLEDMNYNGIENSWPELTTSPYAYTFTATALKKIQDSGMRIRGENFTFQKATLYTEKELGAEIIDIKTYTLTVNAAEHGTVTVKKDGTEVEAGTFDENTELTLTATPEEGYQFVKWQKNGEDAGTDNTLTVKMDGDISITAVFEEIPTPIIDEETGETDLEEMTAQDDATTTVTYDEETETITMTTTENYKAAQIWFNEPEEAKGNVLIVDITELAVNVTVTVKYTDGTESSMTSTTAGALRSAARRAAEAGTRIAVPVDMGKKVQSIEVKNAEAGTIHITKMAIATQNVFTDGKADLSMAKAQSGATYDVGTYTLATTKGWTGMTITPLATETVKGVELMVKFAANAKVKVAVEYTDGEGPNTIMDSPARYVKMTLDADKSVKEITIQPTEAAIVQFTEVAVNKTATPDELPEPVFTNGKADLSKLTVQDASRVMYNTETYKMATTDGWIGVELNTSEAETVSGAELAVIFTEPAKVKVVVIYNDDTQTDTISEQAQEETRLLLEATKSIKQIQIQPTEAGALQFKEIVVRQTVTPDPEPVYLFNDQGVADLSLFQPMGDNAAYDTTTHQLTTTENWAGIQAWLDNTQAVKGNVLSMKLAEENANVRITVSYTDGTENSADASDTNATETGTEILVANDATKEIQKVMIQMPEAGSVTLLSISGMDFSVSELAEDESRLLWKNSQGEHLAWNDICRKGEAYGAVLKEDQQLYIAIASRDEDNDWPKVMVRDLNGNTVGEVMELNKIKQFPYVARIDLTADMVEQMADGFTICGDGITVTRIDIYQPYAPQPGDINLKALNGGWNSTYDATTHTITTTARWAACGWDIGDDRYNDYDLILVKFDAVDFPVTLKMEYTDADGKKQATSAGVAAGSTAVELAIPESLSLIDKVYLIWQKPASLTLTSAEVLKTSQETVTLDLALFEAMGDKVTYDNEAYIMTSQEGYTGIQLWLGDANAIEGGQQMTLTTANEDAKLRLTVGYTDGTEASVDGTGSEFKLELDDLRNIQKVMIQNLEAGVVTLTSLKVTTRVFGEPTIPIKYTGTTGIDTLEQDTDEGEWYNLNGQRTTAPQKGLYIRNGRKVIK